MQEEIEIIHPKPYTRVGAKFVVSGRIPKSLMKTDWGSMDYRVLGGFLNIDGLVVKKVKESVSSLEQQKIYKN